VFDYLPTNMGARIHKATTIFDTLRNSMQRNGIKYVYFLQLSFRGTQSKEAQVRKAERE
jgi:hypothetical protein